MSQRNDTEPSGIDWQTVKKKLPELWWKIAQHYTRRELPESSQVDPQIVKKELSEVWWELVEQYTLRELTEPDDILPAISGLASQLKQKYNPSNTYCAGLWLSNFVRELAWHRDEYSKDPVVEALLPELLLGHGCLVAARLYSHIQQFLVIS